MSISVGGRLPEATFVTMGKDGPEMVALGAKLTGRKVVVFGLPGAFTGPCSTIHMPSFVRNVAAFKAKGVEEIVCIAVNDPFVLKAWGAATGATEAGITLLGDADGTFTKALGMDFTAPQIGLIGRSNRYAVVLADGKIIAANVDQPGECRLSVGEELLEAI